MESTVFLRSGRFRARRFDSKHFDLAGLEFGLNFKRRTVYQKTEWTSELIERETGCVKRLRLFLGFILQVLLRHNGG